MAVSKAKNIEVLTLKEKKFCDEYLVNNFNGTRAYLFAYPNTKTENVAGNMANKLLKKPKVKKYLASFTEKMSKAKLLTAEEVLIKIQNIATANIVDFFKDVNDNFLTLEDLKALPRELTEAIKTITPVLDRETGLFKAKIELHDKNKAIENLGRYYKLFTDKIEEKSETTLNINFNIPRPDKGK